MAVYDSPDAPLPWMPAMTFCGDEATNWITAAEELWGEVDDVVTHLRVAYDMILSLGEDRIGIIGA
jgi:hypothetical protein